MWAGEPAAQPESVEGRIDALEVMLMADPRADHMAAVGNLRILRRDLERSDYTNALTFVQGFGSMDASSPDVQKAVAALMKTIAEEEKRDRTESASKADALLNRATGMILSAKAGKDLDGLVVEMQAALDHSRFAYARDSDTTFHKLESANRFVKDWQSYLVDKNAEDAPKAAADLHNIAERENTFSPIPRSELLERAEKEMRAAQFQVMGKPLMAPDAGTAKKPDEKAGAAAIRLESETDIPDAIAQLEAEQRAGVLTGDYYEITTELNNLERARDSLEAKDYASALGQMNSYGGGGPGVVATRSGETFQVNSLRGAVRKLKNRLKLRIVQGLLGDANEPAPTADEPVLDYLSRIAVGDARASAWVKLQETLLIYQAIIWPPSGSWPWLTDDLTGVRNYLIGEKQEQAGQTLDAIRSYRQALATTGKYFPAQPVAEKLKELQGKFPALYGQAVQQPLSSR